MASKYGGQKASTNTAAPKFDPFWSCWRDIVKRWPVSDMGKADILQEETVKSTVEATGVWDLASIEGFTEITTGRSYFQLK
jgi:hypothetical protein